MKRILLFLIAIGCFKETYAQNSPVGLKYDENQLALMTGTTAVADATADGGYVIYRPSTAPNNTVWYGPYAHLQGGNYLVQFRLKVSSNTSGSTLFYVDIVDGMGATNYGTLAIVPNMFRASNEWQLFSVPVSLPNNNTSVEIRGVGFQSGIADISLDYVNVIPGDAKGYYSNEYTVTGSGAVGINTNYVPSGYQLAVNGSAIATSMTVKLQQNWPDYVFRKDYQLPALTEVKAYIDQNHHLQGIPSEQEVVDKGLDLGEMNKLLTKKVEELTLYLIEKDKKDADQQKEIDDLKAEVKVLLLKSK